MDSIIEIHLKQYHHKILITQLLDTVLHGEWTRVTFNTPNGRDKERRKYFLITENVTELFPILNNSGDQSSGYTTTEVTTNIKKLTFTSISGPTPKVTGTVLHSRTS